MRKVHFIGIGGIGVSYLAQWYLANGWRVSGSDLADRPILKVLRRKGAAIRVGSHSRRNIPKGTDLVIYTLAARPSNPERLEAKRRGIRQLSHAEALGELTKTHYTIAIAGSHGKSTTTALAGLLLRRAGLDPTVFLGTTLKEFGGTNCLVGRSPYLVIEADEWNGAFWNYRPHIAVLTNIDREHLDFYRNFAGVKKGFDKFLSNLPQNGIVIANADDPAAFRAASRAGRVTAFYSLRDPFAGRICKALKIPGEHNVSNALAVGALARVLGISQKDFLRTVAAYRGAWRRFEYRGTFRGAKLFDDYGHHPTEIKATLAAARSLLKRANPPRSRRSPYHRLRRATGQVATLRGGKLWCVFQPHQYRRLKTLFADFAASFGAADRILILPVYAVEGREGEGRSSVNAERLAHALARRGVAAKYALSFRQAAKILREELSQGDICLLMGAGDIVKIHKFL